MNQSSQTGQKHFVVRKSQRIFNIVSPIERWPDENYMPHTLDYRLNLTPTNFQIAARLHGFSAQDVHVDLARGCILILLARNQGSLEQGEYYCEVPLPVDTQQNIACVEIRSDVVIVTLKRQETSVIQRAITEITRLRTAFLDALWPTKSKVR